MALNNFKQVTITVLGSPADAAVTGCVNAFNFSVPRNKATRVPAPVAEAISNAGYPVHIEFDEPAPAIQGDGESADGGADGNADGVPVFDPEAIIGGNVDDVVAALSGLSPEQLAAVEAAEIDREKPRKGVLEAIKDLKPAE